MSDMDLVGKATKMKRYHINGLIDSYLSESELSKRLEELGFYHFKVPITDIS